MRDEVEQSGAMLQLLPPHNTHDDPSFRTFPPYGPVRRSGRGSVSAAARFPVWDQSAAAGMVARFTPALGVFRRARSGWHRLWPERVGRVVGPLAPLDADGGSAASDLARVIKSRD